MTKFFSLSKPRNYYSKRVNMKTIEENETLGPQERLEILMDAKGGTWYNGWKPFCLNCSCSQRMEQTSFGFKCPKCKNLIGWDLTRLQESPLNL